MSQQTRIVKEWEIKSVTIWAPTLEEFDRQVMELAVDYWEPFASYRGQDDIYGVSLRRPKPETQK